MLKKQSSLLDFFKKPPAPAASVQSSQDTNLPDTANQSPNAKNSISKEASNSSVQKTSNSLGNQLKKLKGSSPITKNGSKKEPTTSANTPKTSVTKKMSQNFLNFFQRQNSQTSDHQTTSSKKVRSGSSNKKKTTTSNKENKKKKTPPPTPKGDDPDVFIDIEKDEGNAFDYDNFIDVTPLWAMKENARDTKGRRPGDLNYDPTTLYVPPEELKKYTPTMQQYWQIKSQNFDKIIMFKLGKFYELFYEDALICHKELDLKWMANKMHVGFPEKALERFGYELIQRGYKLCVVEQTETPKQMEERLKKKASIRPEEKTIKREMVQVMSKGTYVDPDDPNHEPRILLSLRNRKSLISVVFLDIGFNKISLGCFQDDENHTIFKTFVSLVRPTEVVYETIEINPDLIKILKNCSSQPVLSPLNDAKAWNSIFAYAELQKYYGAMEQWPENLAEVTTKKDEKDDFAKDQLMVCFSGMISYLTQMLIVDNVLVTARYEIYDVATFAQLRMILDSQALQHLEVLEVEYSMRNRFEGSLLSYIDKTGSKFGKRLLRKWICAPLLSIKAINERLDAVEDLEKVYELRSRFINQLKNLSDLERNCGRIYKYSVKRKQMVVMFEDVSLGKLKEFKRLLDNMRKARDMVLLFKDASFKSEILQRLTQFEDYNLIMEGKSGNMPEILPLLEEISNFVSWGGSPNEPPSPKQGVDKDYDAARKEVEGIQEQLGQYLVKVQAHFGNDKRICYVHSKKRYEIEVPAELVAGSKKPLDFEFSSKKQNKERFITKKTQELVEKLEQKEEEMKAIMEVFVSFLFSYFHSRHKIWDSFIEGLAQLDCLCSLSMTSFISDGVMCRPNLYPPNEKVFIDVRNMRHPCISMVKANFIPNDIRIGDLRDQENDFNIILLTGPNMGGKSTVLRQACIAAILSQIGCYVPANSCSLSIVDRIFTRIGASDRLLEGKSTFYIEMEETLNVLRYGTQNSLAIMDELGRGTSTYDGLAIAYSVLKHLSTKLGCRTLFATHYHVLLDEFRDDPRVKFYHMAAKFDTDNERVVFLYKLITGECSNSFGLNIAKVSGLPETTLKAARAKAKEFEKEFSLRENVQTSKVLSKVLAVLSEGITQKNIKVEDCIEEIENALKLIR